MRMVTLQLITMVVPTAEGIYAPSRISKPKQVTYAKFLAKYADYPRPVMVSFDPDGKSNPQLTTAYGNCWYIVVDSVNQPETVVVLESEE